MSRAPLCFEFILDIFVYFPHLDNCIRTHYKNTKKHYHNFVKFAKFCHLIWYPITSVKWIKNMHATFTPRNFALIEPQHK